MSKNLLRGELFHMNCRYNFKITENGKCYSTECVMNTDPVMKEIISKEGCKCFEAEAVQNMLTGDK